MIPASITLEPVTAENIDAVLRLALKPEQTGCVSPPARAIARSCVHRDWIPLAICSDGVPVGFVQYVVGGSDGRSWLRRLLIDGEWQGRGYGKLARNGKARSISAAGPATRPPGASANPPGS